MFFKCKECGEDFEFKDIGAFVQFHICKVHKITSQQYYDKHIAKEGEGYCLNCGKRLKFRSLSDGYSGRTCRGRCSHILNENSQVYYDKFLKKEEDGICKVCGKPTCWLGSNNQKRKPPEYPKYAVYCSNQCQWQDKEQHYKREQSNLEKYGVKNVLELEVIKQKSKQTKLEKYGDENYSNRELSKETIKEKYGSHSNLFQQIIIPKLLERYGVENVFQLEEVNEKRKETYKEHFGVEHISQSEYWKNISIPKIRKTQEQNGKWIPLEKLSDFEKYRRNVMVETRKNVKILWKEWDCLDYYTKEKLITNEEYKILYPNKHKNTNKLQPSVDHKFPILLGFLEGIDYKFIGSINNLCITSRQNNSKKNILKDKEFLERRN